MNVSEMFTDDQLAVLFCLGALAVSGLIAAVSYHLGPAGRLNRQQRREAISIQGSTVASPEQQDQRRAA